MKKILVSCAALFTAVFLSLISLHSSAETVAPVCTGGANCWKTVKPAEIDPGLWGNARCNDGTPGSYQIRPSPVKSKDWVIVYEGGGACDDLTAMCSERLATTKARTTTSVQSNNSWGKITHGGIISHKADINPDFYNANLVLIDYCSSDLWTGGDTRPVKNSVTPDCLEYSSNCGWYFAGRYNSSAAIESLKALHGLSDEKGQRIMFVGSSAGGFGLAANASLIKRAFPTIFSADGLRFVLDGSYLLDGWDQPDHFLGSSQLTSLNDVALKNRDFWVGSYESACEFSRFWQSLDTSLCALGSVFYPYLVSNKNGLGLKVLLQNSTRDSVALKTLALGSADPLRERWRCAMTDSLKQVDWLFSSGETYHTLMTKNPEEGATSTSTLGFNAGPPGKTLRELVGRFWRNMPAERVVYKNSACQ